LCDSLQPEHPIRGCFDPPSMNMHASPEQLEHAREQVEKNTYEQLPAEIEAAVKNDAA